jgi:hypothetical protein
MNTWKDTLMDNMAGRLVVEHTGLQRLFDFAQGLQYVFQEFGGHEHAHTNDRNAYRMLMQDQP